MIQNQQKHKSSPHSHLILNLLEQCNLVDQYPGQSLACNLYLKGGIRSSEIGSVMFGKKGKKGELIPASMELVRLAIPRRVYTQSHVDYVIEVFQKIKEQKNKAKGIKIVKEQKYLRHFTSHFKFL